MPHPYQHGASNERDSLGHSNKETRRPRIIVAGPWNQSTDSTFYRRVASRLSELGAEVRYFADRDPVPFQSWDASLFVEQFPTTRCRSMADVVWVARRIRELRPDLVCARFAPRTATIIAGALNRVPVRIAINSTSPAALSHDWKQSRLKLSWLNTRQMLFLRLATNVFTLSPGHADEVRAAFHLPEERVEVRPIGVTDFVPDVPRTDSVICVARITAAKGQRQLLEALRGTDIPVSFVGDGPDRDEVAALAHRLGVTARFTGTVPPKDVARELASARVAVLLTVGDAFPLSLVESLVVGTPVVTTPASGPRFIVRDEVDGFIVDPDDPAAVGRRSRRRWASVGPSCRGLGASGSSTSSSSSHAPTAPHDISSRSRSDTNGQRSGRQASRKSR